MSLVTTAPAVAGASDPPTMSPRVSDIGTSPKVERDPAASDGLVLAQLRTEEGEAQGAPLQLPLTVTPGNLHQITNLLLHNEEPVPFVFYVDGEEIRETLGATLPDSRDEEAVVSITFQPQAVFRVQPVTRCTSSVQAHAEAIISVQFSPSGSSLASGSGDSTVRLYDLDTEAPRHTLRGHTDWVLCVAWAPSGTKLASACKRGHVNVWSPETGKKLTSRPLEGHKGWITCLQWKPLHLDEECRWLASSSKDTTVKIWDTVRGECKMTLCSHTMSVTSLRWSGSNTLFSASQDRAIIAWNGDSGALKYLLRGHAHWVNSLALSTDYVLRTGAFDPQTAQQTPDNAQQRYDLAARGGERLVSGSDDFTMFLWTPESSRKPVARLTGHQQLINDVRFSPDTRYIASASFDKSVKLWHGVTGKFISSLRGHVQRVYQVAWSADSRLLVSSSADSTVKVWCIRTRKLLHDLPGHADEVYAVDWSPDSQLVASGGKDKLLKLWRR